MLRATINFAMEDVRSEPKPETDKPMPSPVMDVMPPSSPVNDNRPHAQPIDHPPKQPIFNQDVAKSKDSVNPKEKQPTNGVATAITATVIIVIAMAVLATYAYLKTAR